MRISCYPTTQRNCCQYIDVFPSGMFWLIFKFYTWNYILYIVIFWCFHLRISWKQVLISKVSINIFMTVQYTPLWIHHTLLLNIGIREGFFHYYEGIVMNTFVYKYLAAILISLGEFSGVEYLGQRVKTFQRPLILLSNGFQERLYQIILWPVLLQHRL